MTGAGAPGAPGIIECLLLDPAINLTVADADENATGRYLHPDFVHIPTAFDEQFTEKLLQVCLEKRTDVVLPLVTKELFPLSANKDLFEERGVKVLVSSFEAIETANNKSRTYGYLQYKNIEVPAFRIVHTIEEFEIAVKELGYPGKAVCFKPAVSNGSRGFRIITEKVNQFDLLFHFKPNHTYISYNEAVRILSMDSLPEILVTEYLPGEEYSVDCLCYHGEARLVVPRLRIKMINGISVQGEFVKDEEIIHYCRKIIETIGLHGNIGIQVKRSEKGRPLLLEINPRVQGTIVAGIGAGINLPLLAIKQELDLPILQEELEVRWGTRFSRYWTEVFY
jgi:carbamoyl-phosphate synthase large subunit